MHSPVCDTVGRFSRDDAVVVLPQSPNANSLTAGYYIRGGGWGGGNPSRKKRCVGRVTERRGIEAGSGTIVSQYPAGVTTAANRKSWVREATGSR